MDTWIGPRGSELPASPEPHRSSLDPGLGTCGRASDAEQWGPDNYGVTPGLLCK